MVININSCIDMMMCRRPLFRKFSQELDTTADFVIYKADSSRLCEEETIKLLQDLRRYVICFLLVADV